MFVLVNKKFRRVEGIAWLDGDYTSAAMSVRAQGGMQNAETGDGTLGGRAAEVEGKEGKTPNSHRSSTEAPPKLHRNITLTTP